MVETFNLVVLALALAATLIVYLNRKLLRSVGAFNGAALILSAVWLRAIYSLADWVTIVSPDFLGDDGAKRDFVERLHSNFEWPFTALFVFLIVAGLAVLVHRIYQQSRNREFLEQEETLHQERLSQAAEIARLGYYVWDPIRDVCLYCSETHAAFHGVTPDAYVAQASALDGPFSLTAAEDREFVRKKYLELRGGEPIRIEYSVYDGEKDVRLREIARPIFDENQNVVREIGTTLDITEQYLADAKLRRREKLETIGQLSGGIAHDFNNLLAIVIGNLELLDNVRDVNEERILVSNAIAAAVRGADLAKNLLTFARRADLSPEVLDLNGLVRDAQNWIGRTIEANIEVETSLLARLWRVNADRGSVESALLNLVINARDAMPNGGKLTVETSNVRIDQDHVGIHDEDIPEGRYVLLAVSDTGSGIKKADLDRIFEPFYSTKDESLGTGLGLSSIQGFMAQSGGVVRVYSEVGVGTTFKLYFPALLSEDIVGNSVPFSQQKDRQGTKLRVLLAEDQDDVRDILQRMLEFAGHDVVACPNGDLAFATFADDQDFDLLVSDVVMPGKLQGTALANEARNLKPSLAVIFVSGYASEATVHGNGLRPEDIRLMKPVRRKDLLEALDKVESSLQGNK